MSSTASQREAPLGESPFRDGFDAALTGLEAECDGESLYPVSDPARSIEQYRTRE